MRALVFAVVAFALGLVIGGYPPRAEVRELEAKLEDARDSACGPGMGQDLARLFAVGAGTSRAQPYGDPEQIAAENPEAAELVAELDAEQAEVGQAAQELAQNVPDEDLQALRAALQLRRAQARAALVESADPTDTQLMEFDLAVKEMNERLISLASDVTGMIQDGDPIARRDAMVFAAETLDALIATEDRFTDLLTEDQLDEVDLDALDPFSYVDPAIVDTFAQLGVGAP